MKKHLEALVERLTSCATETFTKMAKFKKRSQKPKPYANNNLKKRLMRLKAHDIGTKNLCAS